MGRELTPADVHSVAVNILNVKRDGQSLIPSAASTSQLLRGNGIYGREYFASVDAGAFESARETAITVHERAQKGV